MSELVQPTWDELYEENQKLRKLAVELGKQLEDAPNAKLLHAQNQQLSYRVEKAEDLSARQHARILELEKMTAGVAGPLVSADEYQKVIDDLQEEVRSLQRMLEERD